MSSIIDEDIPEDVDDAEIKSLKDKIAQIPSKYPAVNKEENDSLASSLVASFDQINNNKNLQNNNNESFHIKEASENYDNDFHDDNEVYNSNTKKDALTLHTIDSNINSKKMLDLNEEKLSSNISGFVSNNKITSNISFKYENLNKNEENLSSNISVCDRNELNYKDLNDSKKMDFNNKEISQANNSVHNSNDNASENNSIHSNKINISNKPKLKGIATDSKKNIEFLDKTNNEEFYDNKSKNSIHNSNKIESNHSSLHSAKIQHSSHSKIKGIVIDSNKINETDNKNSSKNINESKKNNNNSLNNSIDDNKKLSECVLKGVITDSNLTSQLELSENGRKLSSNLSFISKHADETDSNISFAFRKLSENQDMNNSNYSIESLQNNKPLKNIKDIESSTEPNHKPTKLRPQTAKPPEKPKENKETVTIKLPPKPVKKPNKLTKIIKKSTIEEKGEEEEKENDEIKPKTFLIKRLNSKENHKDLVKKIMEDYEKKEQKYKEKEADLYVLETLEKKNINENKNEDDKDKKKNTWNSDTKLEKFNLDLHKKNVKKMVAETKNQAQKFLEELQAKLNKKQEKKTQINNFIKNKDNNDDLFEENAIDKGDQLLPDRKYDNRDNELFQEENEKNLKGDQLLPPDQKIQKKADEIQENNNEKLKDDEKNKDNQKINEDKEEIDENHSKPQEDTWKYPIGNGQKSEYEKTQKTQEIEAKRKTTEVKKTQSQNMTAKKQKMLDIEKELRKKQKVIQDEQKNNAQIAKPIKALDKLKEKVPLDKPANVQSEANGVEKNEVDSQNLRVFKSEFNELIKQNKEIKVALKTVLLEKQKLDGKINELQKNKKVICLPNGKFTSFGFVPSINESIETKASSKEENSLEKDEQNENISDDMSLNSVEQNKAFELSVIGRIVAKIAAGGLKLPQVFELLDMDGDKILTMNEIKEYLPKLNLNLTSNEITELIKQIDSNTDGIVNKEEFINCLEKPLEIERKYFEIMGNIEPVVMEERKMDIMIRKKMVSEEISKQEKEMLKDQTIYNKTIKKLKKYEDIFNKSNRNTAESRNENKKNLIDLQISVQGLESKLQKLDHHYQDKLREIDENLKSLKEDLVKRAQRVIESKDLLSSQKNLYQKLQIKQITYDKISDKLKKDLEMINENEIKLNKLMQENLRIKAGRNEAALKKLYMAVNSTFFIIRLQSFFRMKLNKKKLNFLKKALPAKRVIIKYYVLYRRRKKFMGLRKKLLFVIKNKKKSCFHKIREFVIYKKNNKDVGGDDLYKENKIEEGDELLPELAFTNQKESTYIVPIEVKNLDELYEQNYLASAITIQRKWREKMDMMRDVQYDDKTEKCCLICKHAGKNKALERICRKCKDSFYCFECFEIYHKSKQTRNHPYYDVAKNGQEILATEENLKTSIEQIVKKLKGNFEKLDQEFEDEDQTSIGLVKLEFAEKVLNNNVNKEKDDFVWKMVKLICKSCVEKASKSKIKFKNDKNKFNKNFVYMNYDSLLSLLSAARETPKENEEQQEESSPLL